MIKVLNHSNIAKESRLNLYVAPEDNRTYDEIMVVELWRLLDLIDGYANPIIELLEDREIYEGSLIYIEVYSKCLMNVIE